MSEESSGQPQEDAASKLSESTVLPTPDGSGLSPNDRPVNIERGRELYRQGREIITDFRDRIRHELHLGDKTSAALADICTELVETPGALRIYDNNSGRFFRGHEDGSDLHMELSPSRVDSKADEIAEAVEKSGVKLTREQMVDLATHALAYHELGHALQEAYRRAAEPYSELSGISVKYPHGANLTRDAVRNGVAKPVLEDPKLFDMFADTVDSECLPVGLEQMLAARYAQQAFGLDAHDAEVLRTHLTPAYRHEAVAAAMPLVLEHADDIKARKVDIDKILATNTQTRSIKSLGYGAPYDPATTRKIMEHTGEWEVQTADERFYPHTHEQVQRWRELKAKWDEEDLPGSFLNSRRSGEVHDLGVYDLDINMLLASGPARQACTISDQVDGEAIVRAAAAIEATGSTEPVKVPTITFSRSINGQIYMNVPKDGYTGPVPKVAREVLIAALSGHTKVRAKVVIDEEHLLSEEGQAFLVSLGSALVASS